MTTARARPQASCTGPSAAFGFLTLAPDAADPRWRGMGRDGASLSLLDLANPHYVEQHVEFLAARSGYNTGTTSFLQWLCALLRPKTGYFWQARSVGWADFPPGRTASGGR